MAAHKSRILMGTALASFIAFSLGAVAASAGTSVGGGNIRGFNGVQVTSLPDSACTAALEFEDMPGMSVRFRLHQRGAVVVMFQGQFGGFESDAGARPAIRIVIDDQIVGSAIAIASDPDTGLTTFGFNAFSTVLRPGVHTAKVLWHSFPEGSTTCVEERSLIVLRP